MAEYIDPAIVRYPRAHRTQSHRPWNDKTKYTCAKSTEYVTSEPRQAHGISEVGFICEACRIWKDKRGVRQPVHSWSKTGRPFVLILVFQHTSWEHRNLCNSAVQCAPAIVLFRPQSPPFGIKGSRPQAVYSRSTDTYTPIPGKSQHSQPRTESIAGQRCRIAPRSHHIGYCEESAISDFRPKPPTPRYSRLPFFQASPNETGGSSDGTCVCRRRKYRRVCESYGRR